MAAEQEFRIVRQYVTGEESNTDFGSMTESSVGNQDHTEAPTTYRGASADRKDRGHRPRGDHTSAYGPAAAVQR